MYKLYSLPGTCSTGINVLLRQLGQDFEISNPADLVDYRSISPTGQVPALEDDGLIITEGAAIALYLMEKHDSDSLKSPLRQKAEFLRWLMFNYATLHPAYSKLFAINKIMAEDPQQGDVLQALADEVSKTWAIIDARLSDRDFIVGESASVVDYLLAIYASWGKYFPNQHIVLGDNTLALINRVSELAEFKKAYESENSQYTLTA